MSKITLYRTDGACSFVPHALLRHLSIPFSSVVMRADADNRYEAADGSLTAAQYRRAVNPSGYVPALVIGGENVITEMPAVLAAVARLAPDPALGDAMLGRDPLERARVLEWSAWLSGSLHAAGFGAYWRPARFADDEAAHPAIRRKAREHIDACFERIERTLAGREHAVGDALTVVDLNLYLFWRWGRAVGIDMGERFPAYALVLRRVEVLEGVREAARDEGLALNFEE